MSTLIPRRRVAVALAGALAALGAAGSLAAQPASAATLNCWTRGAYINPGTFGTWNNTFSHKVVCNLPTAVTTRLYRYSGGSTSTEVRYYTTTSNTNPLPGTFVNQGYATAPLFCGSQYIVTVTAAAPGAGTASFNSGWRQYC